MNVLIIKLGALGDVLRTTPLLTGLRKHFKDIKITWLVDGRCADVLAGNPAIDRLIIYSPDNLEKLKRETFDLSINLDKENEALDALTQIPASKKMGFGRIDGRLGPLDALSDYAYRLGVDDHLKFRLNKKSYQQISFEQVGLNFAGEEYIFSTASDDDKFIGDYLKNKGVDLQASSAPGVIGINTGSGARFAGKRLPVTTYAQLAEKFIEELGAQVFFLGGQDEMERNAELEKLCGKSAINTGSHSISRFASIVKKCDLVVSGDTTAMHIAIAVKVPVLVYFGSTCGAEIELYGRGKKIISQLECAPCYKQICPIHELCMTEIKPETLFWEALGLMKQKAVKR